MTGSTWPVALVARWTGRLSIALGVERVAWRFWVHCQSSKGGNSRRTGRVASAGLSQAPNKPHQLAELPWSVWGRGPSKPAMASLVGTPNEEISPRSASKHSKCQRHLISKPSLRTCPSHKGLACETELHWHFPYHISPCGTLLPAPPIRK
jgi:hypothetical protein